MIMTVFKQACLNLSSKKMLCMTIILRCTCTFWIRIRCSPTQIEDCYRLVCNISIWLECVLVLCIECEKRKKTWEERSEEQALVMKRQFTRNEKCVLSLHFGLSLSNNKSISSIQSDIMIVIFQAALRILYASLTPSHPLVSPSNVSAWALIRTISFQAMSVGDGTMKKIK